MKKLIIVWLLWSFGVVSAQETYYWYKNTKQPLKTYPQQQYVLLESMSKVASWQNKIKSTNIQVNDFQKLSLGMNLKNENTQYWTMIYLPDNISKYDDSEIIYSSPSFITQKGSLVGLSHLFYVKLKSNIDEKLLEDLAEKYHVSILGKNKFMPLWFTLSCTKESAGNALEMANIFYESGLFAAAEPDLMEDDELDCVNDSLFPQQWNLHNTGQSDTSFIGDINYCNVHQITTGDSNIIVAVIDEGVDLEHPDLTNIYRLSYDTERDQSPSLLFGTHGTRCAGIIGANADNDIGVAGIAPDCQIMSISNAMAGTPNSRMNRANGINFAWQNGASIISNSWHTGGIRYDVIDDAISDACTYGRNGKGCIIVGATGNWDIAEIDYPAILENVIAVGAIVPCGMRKSLYSCDEEYGWGSNYGNELSVVAPGLHIPTTDTNGTYINDFYGTSAACPHVAGVAALILSVNPDLTWQEVRDIIEQTAQKVRPDLYVYSQDTIHFNGTWNNEMGYGLVDAYAAVSKAVKKDLYVRDDIYDDGSEPSGVANMWNSPDIWLEDISTGEIVNHPIGGTNYYVCVRVFNKNNMPSSGNDVLFVNWVKAGTTNVWPDDWLGTTSYNCGVQPVAKGGYAGSPTGTLIPSIPANGSRIVKVIWTTPYAEDYADCSIFSDEQWHFCLLARIHDSYPIIGEDSIGYNIGALTTNNNNVAWKNLNIYANSNYKSVISVANPNNSAGYFRLFVFTQDNQCEEKISDFADVSISFDETLLSAFLVDTNDEITGAKWLNSSTLQVLDNGFELPIYFEDEYQAGTLLSTVNFYADTIPSCDTMEFDIILVDGSYDVVGGEHYECIRTANRYFQAEITGDSVVYAGTCAYLYATDIEEDADYIWYDEQGTEIENGTLLSVYPSQTTTYTLSVTAHADGYRAFSQYTVSIDSSMIFIGDTIVIIGGDTVISLLTSISPNPANNQVAITYRLPKNETQAVLRILGSQGQRLYQQNISGNREAESRKIVNTSNFAPGQYKVQIISKKGKILDSKTLVIDK